MTKSENRQLNKLWILAPLSFICAGLLPEYIGPVVPFVFFIIVMKNRGSFDNKFRLGSVGTSLLVFIGWMLIGVIYSGYKGSGLGSVALWAYMLASYYFVANVINDEEKLRKAIIFGAIAAGIAGAIAIGQIFLFHFGDYIIKGLKLFFSPFWHPLDALIEKGAKLLPESISSNMSRTQFNRFPGRASSTFSNPLFYSTFGVMTIPFATHCFLCDKEKKINLLGFFCLLLDLGGIACSYSRGPYMYAVIVLCLLFLYGGKKALKLLGFGAGSLLAIVVVANGVIKRLLTLDFKEKSVNTRVDIWKVFFETAKKHPVFGLGTGFNNFRQVLHANGIKQPHAHNIVFQVMVENGIIGVILFAVVFILLLINIIKVAKLGAEKRYYAITLLASIIGFGLCGMTDCLFYGFKPLMYMMLTLGLCQAMFNIWIRDKEINLYKKL